LINKKDIPGEPDVYLKNKFSYAVGDSYYSLVKNNLQVAVNYIIERLHDLFTETLNRTENLFYIKDWLNGLDIVIERNINYWQERSISVETEHWDNMLREQIDWMLGFRYGFILEQDAVLADRMKATFDMMKRHLFIGKLNEIRGHITREDSFYRSTNNSNKEIPKMVFVDRFIKFIQETLGDIDSDKPNIMTIKKRKSEIVGDLMDDTIPILRIYRSGDFKTETENTKTIFLQKMGTAVPTKESLQEKLDLWSYFKSIAYHFHHELYGRTLSSYREKVDQHRCVEDFDVSKYVEQNPKDGIKMARKSLSSFIMLSKMLTPNSSLPKFIVGSDKNSLKNVVRQFQNNSFSEFSDSSDGLLELQELKNILVFYDEKGNFNPLVDLRYIEQMKEVYENKPSGYPELTDEQWRNYRTAYRVKKSEATTDTSPENKGAKKRQ
jgi:hypothetical protein